MSVTLFIQDHAGDHNFEKEYVDFDSAQAKLERIQRAGGYWVIKDDESDGLPEEGVFVPWHRVDYASIEAVEEK